MTKRLIAVAVIVAGVVGPASGQRSGGHGGAVEFRASNATVYRAGSVPMGRPGSVGAVQFRSGQIGGNHFAAGVSDHRLGLASLEANHRRTYLPSERRDRRAMAAPTYIVGLPYSIGYIGPGFLDSPDFGDHDNSAMTAPPPAAMLEPGAQQADAEPEVSPEPNSTFRPIYHRPLLAPAEPEPETAVTPIFKDGRPQEQIYNYMLTRTTLYVQEKRVREIAVADLDLDATAKVNRAAGIDFKLPDSGK